jgi:selenocysteine lyase/cysteine desulfurase
MLKDFCSIVGLLAGSKACAEHQRSTVSDDLKPVPRLGSLELFPPAANFVYLDAASVGLTNRNAAQSMTQWHERLAAEGTVAFDEQAEVACLEDLNRAAARLLNTDAKNVATGSSETVLMSSLAWAVMPQSGTNIVATEITHPSTIYPWMRVAQSTGAEMRWARAEKLHIDPDHLESLIDDNTSVLCLSHVEYGTGQIYDLTRFAAAAHRHGAICVVDITQSAGQVPVDVTSSGIDAAVSSTYKWLCGPFGSGFMYVSPELQQLLPGIVGWRTHKDMWDFRADRLEMPGSAKRYEFGTMAYGTTLGATESINCLLEISISRICAHNAEISGRLRRGLEEMGADVLSPKAPSERSAILAARFPGRESSAFAKTLKQNNIIASLRKDFIRFSPHLYNDSGDIERGLVSIEEVLQSTRL